MIVSNAGLYPSGAMRSFVLHKVQLCYAKVMAKIVGCRSRRINII